jgi:magnesium transporter
VRSLFHKRHPPVGARPGTLAVPPGGLRPRMHLVRYGPGGVEEREVTDPGELGPPPPEQPGVLWLDLQGLGDETTLRRVGDRFGIHPLALEDLVNAPQRPKIEEYQDQLLIIARMARLVNGTGLVADQVGLVLGSGYVLSFQERYGDVLDPVRVRLREGLGPIRSAGADYLAYALLDTTIDGYYPVLEELSEVLARLEERILVHPGPRSLDRLNRVKRVLVAMRRGIWPQREALNRLLRDGSRLVCPEVRVYLRDTYDHAAQVVDVVDSHRDLVAGLLNTYLSALGNRTNEVMKMLTIMASIFIPLTFLAGVYGMNFDAMPELREPWGYPALLGVMILTALSMLYYFRRRGWLGEPPDDEDDSDDSFRGPSPGG